MKEDKIIEPKLIRTVWDSSKKKWYYVIIDVVDVFYSTKDPFDCLKKAKRRDRSLSSSWKKIVTQKFIQTTSGVQKFNCADLNSILKIIFCFTSPKTNVYKSFMFDFCTQKLIEKESQLLPDIDGSNISEQSEASVFGDSHKPDPLSLLFPSEIRSAFENIEFVELPNITTRPPNKKNIRSSEELESHWDDVKLKKRRRSSKIQVEVWDPEKKRKADAEILKKLSKDLTYTTPTKKLGTRVVTRKGLERINRKRKIK